MIGIDIKMPKACMCCELEYWASGLGNRCSATFAETTYNREKSRHTDCPLHPLDDEIRVGDEVKDYTGNSFVILRVDTDCADMVARDGGVYASLLHDITKTGRHFDEVETMLKKMRGEDDD